MSMKEPQWITRVLNAKGRRAKVEEFWNEGEDGWWFSLVDGLNFQECSCIHVFDGTVKRMESDLRSDLDRTYKVDSEGRKI